MALYCKTCKTKTFPEIFPDYGVMDVCPECKEANINVFNLEVINGEKDKDTGEKFFNPLQRGLEKTKTLPQGPA